MGDADRLTRTIVNTVREPYPEALFIPPPKDIWPKLAAWAKENGTSVDAITADTIRTVVGQPYAAARICRAIVEEFRLTEDVAAQAEAPNGAGVITRQDRENAQRAGDLIRAILEVAEADDD